MSYPRRFLFENLGDAQHANGADLGADFFVTFADHTVGGAFAGFLFAAGQGEILWHARFFLYLYQNFICAQDNGPDAKTDRLEIEILSFIHLTDMVTVQKVGDSAA